MWIAGISIGLLAAAGVVAIVRSIPASYASIPDDGASRRETASRGSEGAHARNRPTGPAARLTVNERRGGVRCPECGIVESIRKIELSGDRGGQDTFGVEVAEGDSAGAADAAVATDAATATTYEITVRFRDGSRTVLNDATPRSWRLGSHVIVIGRSQAATNGARIAAEPAGRPRNQGDPSRADGPPANAKPRPL
jgi:hypothetical protein